MSRIIEEEVEPAIRSKAVSKSYREGYDAIDWGPDEPPSPPRDEGYQLGEMDPALKAGLDEITCKLTSYACVQPGWNGTFPVPGKLRLSVGMQCPECGNGRYIRMVDGEARVFDCIAKIARLDEPGTEHPFGESYEYP